LSSSIVDFDDLPSKRTPRQVFLSHGTLEAH